MSIKRYAEVKTVSIELSSEELIDAIKHHFSGHIEHKDKRSIYVDTTFFSMTMRDELNRLLKVDGTPLGARLRLADSITLSA